MTNAVEPSQAQSKVSARNAAEAKPSLRAAILAIKTGCPSITDVEIAAELGCSKGNVRYHLRPELKGYHNRYKLVLQKKQMQCIRDAHGAKCKECGYFRYQGNLQFHHRDPAQKLGTVAHLLRSVSFEAAMEESKKCDLLCANCHGEAHARKHAQANGEEAA